MVNRAGFKCLEALGRIICLQCFDAVGWATGRASGCKNRVVGCWTAGVVVCLKQGADNCRLRIIILYDLHAMFHSRLLVSKNIFMFPLGNNLLLFFAEAP